MKKSSPDIRHVMAAQERGDEVTAESLASELHDRAQRIEASLPENRKKTFEAEIARRTQFIESRRNGKIWFQISLFIYEG